MDGKILRENGKWNFFGVCLVGWEERKINSGIQMFFFWAHQKVFSQNWEKIGRGKFMKWASKNTPHVEGWLVVFFFFLFLLLTCWLLSSFFFFFSLIFLDVLAFFFFIFFGKKKKNCFGLISYAIFFFLTLMKCQSIHNFFKSIMCHFPFFSS